MSLATLPLLAALASPVHAGELAGVTLPDTATLGGQQLVLNGMALREKFYFDVYVGGLYLPARSSDGAAIIALDAPKKLEMSFILSETPAEKTVGAYRECWELDPLYAHVRSQADTFASWIVDLAKGDTMTIQYEPGTGTTLLVNGQAKGAIPGDTFMKLIFGNYVGPNADKALRTGMLGR